IHTSKGLEYPLVFCPFLWDGSLLRKNPDSVSCHDEDGTPLVDLGSERFEERCARARAESFAEHLRLVYVALTRARAGLWVHWGPVQQGPDYQAEEGLHTSALAWLLHGRHERLETLDPQQALSALHAHLQGLPHETLAGELDALIAAHPQHMVRLACRGQGDFSSGQRPRAEPPAPLRQLDRPLFSAWRMGSFSALTAGQHSEAPDRDQSAPTQVSEPGSGFFAFPRGARAGVCLHAIFEDWANGKGPLAER